jgi:hypothetical protein
MRAKIKPAFQWFAEPNDVFTNSCFADYLINNYGSREETLRDTAGKPHNVWPVNTEDLEFFNKSLAQIELKFTVFRRDGNDGPIRRYQPRKTMPKLTRASDLEQKQNGT